MVQEQLARHVNAVAGLGHEHFDVLVERHRRRADVVVALDGLFRLFDAATREGVLVRLLADAGATNDLDRLFLAEERQQLIHCRVGECHVVSDLAGGWTAKIVEGLERQVDEQRQVETGLFHILWLANQRGHIGVLGPAIGLGGKGCLDGHGKAS